MTESLCQYTSRYKEQSTHYLYRKIEINRNIPINNADSDNTRWDTKTNKKGLRTNQFTAAYHQVNKRKPQHDEIIGNYKKSKSRSNNRSRSNKSTKLIPSPFLDAVFTNKFFQKSHRSHSSNSKALDNLIDFSQTMASKLTPQKSTSEGKYSK